MGSAGGTIQFVYRFFYSVGDVSVCLKRDDQPVDLYDANDASLSHMDILPIAALSTSDDGLTCPMNNVQNMGEPRIEGDVFYIFDDIEASNDHDASYSASFTRNASLFHSNEATSDRISGVRVDSIVDYLERPNNQNGLPIFVDNADIKLNEAEMLDVVISYLMGEFYDCNRNIINQYKWELTLENIENLQGYLLENLEEDSALAYLIDAAQEKNVPFIEKYNRYLHRSNKEIEARKVPYKLNKEDAPRLNEAALSDANAKLTKSPTVQWFNG